MSSCVGGVELDCYRPSPGQSEHLKAFVIRSALPGYLAASDFMPPQPGWCRDLAKLTHKVEFLFYRWRPRRNAPRSMRQSVSNMRRGRNDCLPFSDVAECRKGLQLLWRDGWNVLIIKPSNYGVAWRGSVKPVFTKGTPESAGASVTLAKYPR
jgi:hypothetical protein